jgi:hypothetical protein
VAHTHSNSERRSDTGPQPLVNPDELRRHQRALRILIVVLILWQSGHWSGSSPTGQGMNHAT